MERIILLNCNFIFTDVFKKLLKEWIIGVFEKVK